MGNPVQDAINKAKAAAEARTGKEIAEPTVPDVEALKANSQSGVSF